VLPGKTEDISELDRRTKITREIGIRNKRITDLLSTDGMSNAKRGRIFLMPLVYSKSPKA
jgi:hypothetical protein